MLQQINGACELQNYNFYCDFVIGRRAFFVPEGLMWFIFLPRKVTFGARNGEIGF